MDIKKQQQLASELSNKLWAMANDLRGNMEAYEFKNYILGLIFYRYLSERTDDYAKDLLENDDMTYREAWEDDDIRDDVIEEMLNKLGYVIEPDYLFDNVIDLIRKDKFTIEYLEKVIASITESTIGQDSEEDFSGLFDDMDLKSTKLGKTPKDRGKLIAKVLTTLDSMDFDFKDPEMDVLGTAYITLIGLFASTGGKKGGEFYTPTNVSALVARLATVGLSDVKSVFDPTCGSGSLLLEVGKYVNVRQYYGQELTSATYNLARMNMLLHGIDYRFFDIINVDTLENDEKFGDIKFDVQVANPPYSIKWSADSKFLEDERFAAYGKLAPASKADFAFVQHMIYHMADNGRIACLLPHGVLFRGAAEETIRKYIIHDLNYLDAVIGLPANLFQTTGIPVCCLVFKKERNGNSDNIFFIDASKEFTPGKTMNYMEEHHIQKIVDAYTKREDIDKFAHKATMEEVIENDYNLNIPRYVDTFEEEEPVDIQAEKQKLIELQAKAAEETAKIFAVLKELGIE